MAGTGRGRGRGGVTPMQRLMMDIQRQIEGLSERLDNQGIQGGDESDEEGNRRDADQNEENTEERLEEMSYEDRVLRALEGRSEGIKIDVLDYAGSLKPKELIDWLNEMGNFFEWKPMTEEKEMKFACIKLKGHTMIWWDHLQKERTRKGKEKIKTWSKMEKKI